MKTKIVRIGNSLGVRIPRPLLEDAGLTGEVEIVAKKRGLLIRPFRHARAGWAEAFRRMAELGDDALLDAPTATRFDEEEWEWR